jgi:hypothetical protein
LATDVYIPDEEAELAHIPRDHSFAGKGAANMHSIAGDIHADNFAGAVRVLDSILGSVLAKFSSSVPLQTWTQAISGSVVSGETADDKSLSLIERFLEVNRGSIPELVVKLLNLRA